MGVAPMSSVTGEKCAAATDDNGVAAPPATNATRRASAPPSAATAAYRGWRRSSAIAAGDVSLAYTRARVRSKSGQTLLPFPQPISYTLRAVSKQGNARVMY